MSHKIGFFTERLNEYVGKDVWVWFAGEFQKGVLAKVSDRFFAKQGSYGLHLDVNDITQFGETYGGILNLKLSTKLNFDNVEKLD